VENHITHRKRLNRGQLPRFLVEGTHPRIIDDDLFEQVQAERERRRQIGAVRWKTASCFTGKLVCGCCGHTYTYTPGVSAGDLTEYQQGQYRCSNKRNNGPKACNAKNLPLRALRQACCSVIGPLCGACKDANFDSAWIDKYVRQIVVFPDTLEFHLKDGGNLKTPWKSTARSDAWALRREKMARMQANEVKQ
jgi:hypothetical protein